MQKNITFTAHENTTLLPFLRTCLPNKSRNYVKGVLGRGQVRINGQVCRDFAHPLCAGQQIEIQFHTEAANALPIPLLYEDADMLAVSKPAGMLCVASDNEHENTAYRLVYAYMQRQNKAGRVFVVHRLDRDTSGVLLFAKNEKTKRILQDTWDSLAKRRAYVAVVEGQVTQQQGSVTSWLKQTKTLLVYSSGKEGDGKKATTHFRTLRTGKHYSLLELTLETGRKNQIRVHMQDMGHPVAGDKKYGAATDPLHRLGLHAACLELQHPYTGQLLGLESPVPSIFMKPFGEGN